MADRLGVLAVWVVLIVAAALGAMVFVSHRASDLRYGTRCGEAREGFESSAASGLSNAPVSRVMDPFGAVRACSSANKVCGTRDGYYAGDLIVGENLGVVGDLGVKGNLAEVSNVSILNALSVNGLANFDKSVSVGGRLITVREADITGSLSAESANVRGNLDAARLDIGGDAHISGSTEVSGNLSTKAGMISLSGAGYFGGGLGAGGDVVALGDIMTRGNHAAVGYVVAGGDVFAGKRIVSGGDAAFEGSLTAKGGIKVKGGLDVKKGATLDGALDLGDSATVGGNILTEGAKGVVVSDGVVRVGALPAGAEGGALASGVHVERGRGLRTSFPRAGDNLVDGSLLVRNKVCIGAECLAEHVITTFKGYPALFNGKIRDAMDAASAKLAELATSIANRFSGVGTRMDGLSDRVGATTSGVASLQQFDADMLARIGNANAVIDKQGGEIVRIHQRNKVQDVRLDAINRQLKTLEVEMLGAVKAAF